jgi:pyrimidine-nucleoside phosphorylase
MAADGLRRGVGLAKMREIVEAQGGDPYAIDDPRRLPGSPIKFDVTSIDPGYLVDVDPMSVALAANRLGAGRARKGDPIDHAVGIELHRTIGDAVRAGDVLATVHARTEAQAAEAVDAVCSALSIGSERAAPRPVVLDRFSSEA